MCLTTFEELVPRNTYCCSTPRPDSTELVLILEERATVHLKAKLT